jgi:Na+/phosphate symporter
MTAISSQSLLILALVLIVIGAILLYSPIPYPAGTIGNILIVIGIIVLVIWIVLMVVRAIRHV